VYESDLKVVGENVTGRRLDEGPKILDYFTLGGKQDGRGSFITRGKLTEGVNG